MRAVGNEISFKRYGNVNGSLDIVTYYDEEATDESYQGNFSQYRIYFNGPTNSSTTMQADYQWDFLEVYWGRMRHIDIEKRAMEYWGLEPEPEPEPESEPAPEPAPEPPPEPEPEPEPAPEPEPEPEPEKPPEPEPESTIDWGIPTVYALRSGRGFVWDPKTSSLTTDLNAHTAGGSGTHGGINDEAYTTTPLEGLDGILSFDVVGPSDGYFYVSFCSKLPTTLQYWNSWNSGNLTRWLNNTNSNVAFPNWFRGHGITHHSHGAVANAPMGGQYRSRNSNKTGFISTNSTDLNTNTAEQTLQWPSATSGNIPGSVQIEIYNNGHNSKTSSQFGNITISNLTDSWPHANVTQWYLLIHLSRTDMQLNNLKWEPAV